MFEHGEAWTKDLGALKEFINRESVAVHGVFSKENRVVGCKNNHDWHDVIQIEEFRRIPQIRSEKKLCSRQYCRAL